MFKIKFLRNILLASLTLAIILPLYDIFIAYPSFITALTEDTKDESIRIAKHLTSLLFAEDAEFGGDSLPINPDAIETMKEDLNLIKIKVFSPSGEVMYSTDSKDIGKINKKKYFHEIVAKGNVYTKIVHKNMESLEGQLMRTDNVETYVPVMKGDRFLGAFEIYYDIMARKERYDKLRSEAISLVVTLSFGFLLLVTVTSFQANRFFIARRKAEEEVQNQLKRLRVLRSVERAITANLGLRGTLEILVEQVTTQLGINAATVLLLNQHTQILEYVVSRGFRSSALSYTKLNMGESHAGRAATERRIVTIPNLKEKPDGFIRSKQFAEEGFTTYFAVPLIANGQVKGVLELFDRAPLSAEPDWLEFIDTIADQAAIAIDNATLFEGLQRSNIELKLAYDTTIEGWSRAMDLRDKETEGHTQRVTEMTLRIARELGVKEDEIVHIRRGALLHDIGKMGIPDGILLKPGPLTEDEWEIMKRHPVYAYDMLYPIEHLRPAIDLPYCHHEKLDGTGYPRGLKGKEIPLAARIFAVVDVWDALRSDRPYRPAWPKGKVLEHIRSLAGTHFDPKMVEMFLKIVK